MALSNSYDFSHASPDPDAVGVFDDRVGIGVCEPDSRQIRVFVDTDSSEVREWAKAVYEVYESEAFRMEEFTHQGFDEAMQ